MRSLMSELVIEHVEVYAVGPDVPRVRWAFDQTKMYQANVVVRLLTREGVEGIGGAIAYTEHDFDRSLAEALRFLLPEVIGMSALDRELIWKRLATRRIALTPQALSLIDIPCWDMTAKYAEVPLYRLLGGARERKYGKRTSRESRRSFVSTSTCWDATSLPWRSRSPEGVCEPCGIRRRSTSMSFWFRSQASNSADGRSCPDATCGPVSSALVT